MINIFIDDETEAVLGLLAEMLGLEDEADVIAEALALLIEQADLQPHETARIERLLH